jgi:hypothetical protein
VWERRDWNYSPISWRAEGIPRVLFIRVANTGLISARVKKSDCALKKRKKLTRSIFAGEREKRKIGRG